MKFGNMELSYGELAVSVLVAVASPVLCRLIWEYLVVSILWRPWRTRRIFEAQGIKCLPRTSFLKGNLPELVALHQKARADPMPDISHDIAPRILPHLFQWSRTYGDYFVHWFGFQARLILAEPEEAMEVFSTKFGYYPKPPPGLGFKDLVGEGLFNLEGEKWAKQRRILNPAFYMEKLKDMTTTMVDCTIALLNKWDVAIEKNSEIDVHQQFQALTADVIAHTAFGTSYEEGKQVHLLQREQAFVFEKLTQRLYIPGSRFLPTPLNIYRWKLNYKIATIMSGIVRKRVDSSTYGNDLLGIMMAANKGDLKGSQKNLRMGINEIIDNCKNFFLAGHETTASLLTWAMLLLATYTEWQQRIRDEVHTVCGLTEPPTADSVSQLKLVGMVLNETFRLYPPISSMFRQPLTDMKLGKLNVPAKTMLITPIIAWHHNERYWGPDVHEFKPERFDGGISKACKVPGAFMPFSMGPRYCIGQNFALLEAKVVLSLIVQKYRFHLSPTYRHAPTSLITVQPQYGMPIVFEKI